LVEAGERRRLLLALWPAIFGVTERRVFNPRTTPPFMEKMRFWAGSRPL
jgi:hypothetical protein